MTTRLTRRGLLGLGSGLAAAGAWWLVLRSTAAAGTVRGVLLTTGPGGATRLLLTLDGEQPWRLSVASAHPPRLVLRLLGAVWRGTARRLAPVGLVRAARFAPEAGGLLIDLTRPVALRRAALEGGGLAIDLVPGSAAAFARLGAGTGDATAARRAPLVVIDPGHGGRDPGAVGRAGTLEKRITLAAALELKRQLEAGGRCRVVLTRTRDVFVPLADRVAFAQRRGAALFVSLHADSAPGARGSSVYTLSDTASDSLAAGLARRENLADRAGGLRLPSVPPEVQRILMSLVRQETQAGSVHLARLAAVELGESVRLLPNTHRRAGFVVLKAPEIPSVLVEMGFLSHPLDEAALRRPEHRRKVAAALVRAVHDWLARHPHLALGEAQRG